MKNLRHLNHSHSVSIGIYTSGHSFSLEGEGLDEWDLSN